MAGESFHHGFGLRFTDSLHGVFPPVFHVQKFVWFSFTTSGPHGKLAAGARG